MDEQRTKMTAKERRQLVERMRREAAALHLEVVHRAPSGCHVWDAVDARNGAVAARGMSLHQLERYLHGERF